MKYFRCECHRRGFNTPLSFLFIAGVAFSLRRDSNWFVQTLARWPPGLEFYIWFNGEASYFYDSKWTQTCFSAGKRPSRQAQQNAFWLTRLTRCSRPQGSTHLLKKSKLHWLLRYQGVKLSNLASLEVSIIRKYMASSLDHFYLSSQPPWPRSNTDEIKIWFPSS